MSEKPNFFSCQKPNKISMILNKILNEVFCFSRKIKVNSFKNTFKTASNVKAT